jgi:hypothetical protein
VLAAFALAVPLVSAAGGAGAATGIVLAEWLLLLLAARACRAAAFEVELAAPLAWAAVAALPMALAVFAIRDELLLAVPLGVAVQLLATLVARRVASGQKPAGVLRYP